MGAADSRAEIPKSLGRGRKAVWQAFRFLFHEWLRNPGKDQLKAGVWNDQGPAVGASECGSTWGEPPRLLGVVMLAKEAGLCNIGGGLCYIAEWRTSWKGYRSLNRGGSVSASLPCVPTSAGYHSSFADMAGKDLMAQAKVDGAMNRQQGKPSQFAR